MLHPPAMPATAAEQMMAERGGFFWSEARRKCEKNMVEHFFKIVEKPARPDLLGNTTNVDDGGERHYEGDAK